GHSSLPPSKAASRRATSAGSTWFSSTLTPPCSVTRRTLTRCTPPPASGPLKQRLHAALESLGASAFTLDAVDHSEIIQSPAGIEFVAPRHQLLALRNKQIEEALAQVLGRAPRIKLTPGAGNGEAAEPPPPPKPADDEETLQRALAHPAVRRFQEVFPGARVMGVRNLKE
ncbi:MAG TPA: hypothetical protein PLF84_24155, partial [Bryobacteraceae bacterium]|nr:hypothetical protein [Bryobacteraceae bacterium]